MTTATTPDPTPSTTPGTPDAGGPTDAEVVRSTVDIAATPERVFDALTDPRELAEWWGSDDTHRARDWTVDARPGGAWGADTVDADGNPGRLEGEFRVVERPRVLETTWHPSWDDAPSVVRYELEPCDVDGRAGTRLTVTHVGPTRGAVTCLRGVRGLARHWPLVTAHPLRPRPSWSRAARPVRAR